MPVRTIKPGYSNVTADFASTKLDRMIHCESTLERDFALILEYDRQVNWYEEQPITIEYQLRNRSKSYTYTPDFFARRVVEGKEKSVLYEIKFRSDLKRNWGKLKPKFKAAIHKCKVNNWRFKILTEKEIRTPRLQNLEFLDHFNQSISGMEEAYRQVLIDSINELRVATPEELLGFTFTEPMKRAEVVPVLWRLISDGAITANLDEPLTMKSQLTGEWV